MQPYAHVMLIQRIARLKTSVAVLLRKTDVQHTQYVVALERSRTYI